MEWTLNRVPLTKVEQKEPPLLFRYGAKSKQVNKQDLFKFLAQKTAQQHAIELPYNYIFYNSAHKAYYLDAYHFLMLHLDDAVSIEIYNDFAIRLNTYYFRCFVFEDETFINSNKDLVFELLDFVETLLPIE